MNDDPDHEQGQEEKVGGIPLCTCAQDPFASLPAELRPRTVKSDFGLRKVKCPNCGFVYLTNRKTDLCIDSEKKGVKFPDTETKSGLENG